MEGKWSPLLSFKVYSHENDENLSLTTVFFCVSKLFFTIRHITVLNEQNSLIFSFSRRTLPFRVAVQIRLSSEDSVRLVLL